MEIIKQPHITFIGDIDGKRILRKLEDSGRKCWQTDSKEDSSEQFVGKIIGRGHTSVLEHEIFTCDIITDRACYDDRTKVLTNKGWKYFKDVDIDNDLIYTKTEEGDLKFVKATDKIQYPYNGKMDCYRSTAIDLCVTPNHNMWVYDYDKRSEKTRRWKFIESKDLKNGHYLFDRSSNGTNNSNITEIEIPDVERDRGFYKKTFPGHKFSNNEVAWFLELLGIWVTDGSVSFGTIDEFGHRKTGNRISITQVKTHVRNRIFQLLSLLGIGYTCSGIDIRIADQALFDWLVDNFIMGHNTRKSYYLKLPRWMFDMGRYNIDCFLRGVFLGDGWRHSHRCDEIEMLDKVGYGFCIVTGSLSFAEDLVELALLTGRTANIYTRDPGKHVKFPNGYVCEKCKTLYNVSFSSKQQHYFNNDTKHRSNKHYNGIVYCLELPEEHRLFVMRNGKTAWCGNCMAELTRHRIASYSIESTRYVKYNGRMQFIKPVEFCKDPYDEKTPDDYELELIWENSCRESEIAYISMMSYGAKPELARQVLNNSLKTEIRFTINMRSARNFFDLRCDVAAHPHMKQVAIPMLLFLREKVPVLFDDIKYDKKFADKYLKNWRDMVSVKEIGG